MDLCIKASRIKHELPRFTPYMTVRRILMNALCRSQVSYCPLVRMCHSITLNLFYSSATFQYPLKKVPRIYDSDKHSDILNLLVQDRSVSVHIRILQILAIEMYKVSKSIAPKIFTDIFSSNPRANYGLHQQSKFSRSLIKSLFNRAEAISHLGPRIWDLLPLEIKQKVSLTVI